MRITEAREPGALPGDLWDNHTMKARQSQMADSRAKRRWDAENTKIITIKLNNRTDADMISRLTTVDSKSGYIKQLIRQDIA